MHTRQSNRSMFADQRARRLPGAWFFLTLLLLLGGLGIYTAIDNNLLRVETVSVTIPGMGRAFEGYTILHISDLHGKRFGPAQSALQSALRDRSYQVVCITGDMIGQDEDPYPFYELIDALRPGVPVFFILGDEDPQAVISEPHYSNDVLAEFISGAQRHGATYLDAPRPLSVGGHTVWILLESQLSLDMDAAEQSYRNQIQRDQAGGNAQLAGIKARMRALNYQLDVINRVRAAREQMNQGDLYIALVHHPLQGDFVRGLQNWASPANASPYARQLDLVLAGHYNGGQVRLPFLGPLYVPERGLSGRGWLPGDAVTQGLMQVGGVTQFVSPGLGVSHAYSIPFRLFNGPRVTLLRLTASLPVQ
jgi:predicted MPP superfamily phosphohydrolase